MRQAIGRVRHGSSAARIRYRNFAPNRILDPLDSLPIQNAGLHQLGAELDKTDASRVGA